MDRLLGADLVVDVTCMMILVWQARRIHRLEARLDKHFDWREGKG